MIPPLAEADDAAPAEADDAAGTPRGPVDRAEERERRGRGAPPIERPAQGSVSGPA